VPVSCVCPGRRIRVCAGTFSGNHLPYEKRRSPFKVLLPSYITFIVRNGLWAFCCSFSQEKHPMEAQ
jgi:hypothetical protein